VANSVADIANNCFVADRSCDSLPKPGDLGARKDQPSPPDRVNALALKKPELATLHQSRSPMEKVNLHFQGRVFPVATNDLVNRSGLFKDSPDLCELSSCEVRSPARLEDFESFIDFLERSESETNISSISSLSDGFSVSSLSSSCAAFNLCRSLFSLATHFSSIESELSTMSDSISQTFDRLSSIEDRCSSISRELNDLEHWPLVPLLTRGYVKMVLVGDSGVGKTALFNR
jgi:hypothetical protein